MPSLFGRLDTWCDALVDRHASSLTTPELTRALRALSIRYIQRRRAIATRSPIDSPGKRAAFAVFYAPLHLLTTRDVVRSLGADRVLLHTVIDLGCGTGVASAGWALTLEAPPSLRGVDRDRWAVGEALWNWRQLGLAGVVRRADIVGTARRLASRRPAPPPVVPMAGFAPRVPGAAGQAHRTGVIAGWSVNELPDPSRRQLLPLLLEIGRRGTPVLIIEPLARSATPWWDEWASAFTSEGGRADEWKFDLALPARLAELDKAAGFRRTHLGARSLWLTGSTS